MLSQSVQQQDVVCTRSQEGRPADAPLHSPAGHLQGPVCLWGELPRLAQLGGPGQVQVEQLHLTVHAQGKRGLLRREQDQAVGPGGLGHGQGLLLPSLQNGEKSPVQQGVQHLGPDGEAGIRPVEQSAVTGGEGDAVS